MKDIRIQKKDTEILKLDCASHNSSVLWVCVYKFQEI